MDNAPNEGFFRVQTGVVVCHGGLDQPRSTSQQFLHHALFELLGFCEAFLQVLDFSIHFTEYGGYPGLFLF